MYLVEIYSFSHMIEASLDDFDELVEVARLIIFKLNGFIYF